MAEYGNKHFHFEKNKWIYVKLFELFETPGSLLSQDDMYVKILTWFKNSN